MDGIPVPPRLRPQAKRRLRPWIIVVLGVVLPLVVMLAGFEYLIWSYNRTSATFRVSARAAILAMNECADDIDKPGDACEACLGKATEKLTAGRAATRTTADRAIYYGSLEPYLKAIELSRQDWEMGDTSPEAKRHLDEMISLRTRVVRWLNK